MNVFRRTINLQASYKLHKRLFSLATCSKYVKEPILISKSSFSIKEILQARKLRDTLNENYLVAFYHYHDKASNEWAEIRSGLRNEAIHLTIFSNLTSQAYLRTTKYKNIIPFFLGKTITVYTNECQPQTFVKLVNKLSQFVLLGAVYENKLVGNEQMRALSKLPEKEILQGEVIGILNQGGNQLRSMLEQSQRQLVHYLTQIFNNKEANNVN